MRVLMLTTNGSLQDGVNRHILTIAGGLTQNGVEVAVCTVHPRDKLAEKLEKIGVRFYSLNCSHGHDIRILLRFYRVMHNFKPDIVHEHVIAFMERVMLSIFFRSVRYMRTLHGVGFRNLRKKKRLFIKHCISSLFPINSLAVCYVSRGVQEMCSKDFKDAIQRMIYNPIDVEKSFGERVLRRELGLDESVPVIGTACRIAAIKNPAAFTKVMRLVIERMPEVHAVIIGEGLKHLDREMREIAHGCKNIHFLGYRDNARQLLGECNCCIMTSVNEGMPTVLLEAMAADVPVAFWNGGGGLKDLAIINKNDGPIGAFTEQGDIEGLSSKIIDILNGSHKIPKGKIKGVACKYFALGKVVLELKNVYQEIMGNGLQ